MSRSLSPVDQPGAARAAPPAQTSAADRRLNWSTLKHIAVSPRMLRWRVEHPQPDTAALRLGRAIHCAVLEPGEFGTRWIVADGCAATTKGGGQCGNTGALYYGITPGRGQWYCRIRGHAPEGAGDPPEGVEIISGEDRALALRCAESVAAHGPAARLLAGAAVEQTIEWTDRATGILCRGRVDAIRPQVLLDLKSTRRETLREIGRDVADMHLYGQAAWYHDGAMAAGRLSADADRPHLIAVGTVEPYDVAVLRLSAAALEAGRILCRDLLTRYAQCMAADYWPGIAPDVEDYDLPRWAAGVDGSAEEATW